jgi:hypothetical protein
LMKMERPILATAFLRNISRRLPMSSSKSTSLRKQTLPRQKSEIVNLLAPESRWRARRNHCVPRAVLLAKRVGSLPAAKAGKWLSTSKVKRALRLARLEDRKPQLPVGARAIPTLSRVAVTLTALLAGIARTSPNPRDRAKASWRRPPLERAPSDRTCSR